MNPIKWDTFVLPTVNWQHTLPNTPLIYVIVQLNYYRNAAWSKKLGFDWAIDYFHLGLQFSLKLLVLLNRLTQQPITSNSFSFPSLQPQGRHVIYAGLGLAFKSRVIAQGKGDATDVIEISLATFPLAAVLLLAPYRFLCSQGKHHFQDFAPMKARGTVSTVLQIYG